MDARRGQIYGGVYERVEQSLKRRSDEVVMTPGEFLEFLAVEAGAARVAFVSPTPEVLAQPLAGSVFRDQRVQGASSVLAPVIGELGFARAGRGELVDAAALDASYVRRSDAQLLWKGP